MGNTEMITHKKLTIGQVIKRGVFIFIGALLVALGLETFFVPSDIVDGGVTGISLISTRLTGMSLGLFLFILNVPFIILGYKQIGKTFAISSLFGVSVMSIGTFLIPHGNVTHDPLLSSVFGGLMLGVGVGIVIRNGGCTDGTEVVAILINKKVPFSVGEIVLFINIFILLSAGLIFGWDKALYSIIAYYIAYKMIDLTMDGFQDNKSVWIVSDKARDIGDAILSRLGRGVTYLHGEGAYTGGDKQVVFCVVTRLEETKLKDIVDTIDHHAFLTIGSVSEVRGGRFKKKDIH